MVFIGRLFRLVAICATLAVLLAAVALVVSAEPVTPAQTAARATQPAAAPTVVQTVAGETDRLVAESKTTVRSAAPAPMAPAEQPGSNSAGAAQALAPAANDQPSAAASLPQIVHNSPIYDARSGLARKGKWIEIILSEQRLIAWEDGRMVLTTPVSTGTANTPTIRGVFRIYRKLPAQRMRGRDYDLPNVPYVMYFKASYAMHGAYWHNNFGQPMSHGCVNIPTGKAAWLYDWAPRGTVVVVH
jgi:lipoprotein-anchoring transpeptidase ErfK/SrfK